MQSLEKTDSNFRYFVLKNLRFSLQFVGGWCIIVEIDFGAGDFCVRRGRMRFGEVYYEKV